MARTSTKPTYSATSTTWIEVGSPEHTASLIESQDRARAQSEGTVKTWAPWLIGGLIVGGAAYLLLRD